MWIREPCDRVFIRRFWDGGYSRGALFCGVGALVEMCYDVPPKGTSPWKLVAFAYGRRQGRSAVSAEMEAATMLIQLVLKVLLLTQSS